MKTTPYFYLSFLILTVEVAQAHGKVGLVAVNIQPPATARSSASENNSLKNDETQQTAEPTGNEANAMAQQSTSVRELAAAGPTASLDPRQVVKKISAITSETRNRILDEIKTRIEASERALANLRDQLDKQGQGNLEFNNALNDAKSKERALRLTLGQARAADALALPTVRSILSGDYDAYASATAKAEALAKSPKKP